MTTLKGLYFNADFGASSAASVEVGTFTSSQTLCATGTYGFILDQVQTIALGYIWRPFTDKSSASVGALSGTKELQYLISEPIFYILPYLGVTHLNSSLYAPLKTMNYPYEIGEVTNGTIQFKLEQSIFYFNTAYIPARATSIKWHGPPPPSS